MPIRSSARGAVAALALLLALGARPALAAEDWRGGPRREAVDRCVNHAEDILAERGNRRPVGVEEITRLYNEGDQIYKVQGWLRVYDGDGRRRLAWLDCDVNFRAEEGDKIAYFDRERFLSSNRDRPGGWEQDWRRPWPHRGDRGDAVDACRNLVEDQGYDVADVRDRTERGARVEMRLRRYDRRWTAVCVYDDRREEAYLVSLDRD